MPECKEFREFEGVCIYARHLWPENQRVKNSKPPSQDPYDPMTSAAGGSTDPTQ